LAGPGDLTSYSLAVRGSFPEVEWPECEADYLSPFNAKLTNAGSPFSSFPICLYGMVLNEQQLYL